MLCKANWPSDCCSISQRMQPWNADVVFNLPECNRSFDALTAVTSICPLAARSFESLESFVLCDQQQVLLSLRVLNGFEIRTGTKGLYCALEMFNMISDDGRSAKPILTWSSLSVPIWSHLLCDCREVQGKAGVHSPLFIPWLCT